MKKLKAIKDVFTSIKPKKYKDLLKGLKVLKTKKKAPKNIKKVDIDWDVDKIIRTIHSLSNFTQDIDDFMTEIKNIWKGDK